VSGAIDQGVLAADEIGGTTALRSPV
jgi:hypothetical protein